MESPHPSAETPFPIKKSHHVQGDLAPDMPPQMASVKSHSASEIVEMMNKTPLFMTSLDDTAGEGICDAFDPCRNALN